MITWVVEDDPRFHDSRNASRLGFAAQERGHRVCPIPLDGLRDWEKLLEGVKYPAIPFVSLPTLLELKPLGNPNLCIWYDREEFSCSSYLMQYRDLALNSTHLSLEKQDLRDESFVNKLYLDWAAEDVVFFRPNDNEKSFPGDTIHRKQISAWLHFDLSHLPDGHEILVAKPRKLEAEYRTVVVNGRAVTGSRYRYKGHLDLERLKIDPSHPVCRFAEHTADTHSMSPLYVCDVAELADGSYKIVEVGDFAVAGLYNCDVRLIVEAVERIF